VSAKAAGVEVGGVERQKGEITAQKHALGGQAEWRSVAGAGCRRGHAAVNSTQAAIGHTARKVVSDALCRRASHQEQQRCH
tara:strand:+ start:5131 stop:5373 length:243 start_codon:yes stop_codon:yes gene_type:complete